MPKISRSKLLEYLDTELAEELDLYDILRYCDIVEEEDNVSVSNQTKKNRKSLWHKSKT